MAVNQSVRAALDICKCLYLCIMTAGIYSCDVAPWPPFLSGAGLTDPTPSPASHTLRGVLTRCWLSFEVSRFRPATQLCGLIDSKIGSVCVAGVGGWWSGVGGVIEGGAKYSGSRSEWVGPRSQLPCMHSGSTCAHTYTRVRAPRKQRTLGLRHSSVASLEDQGDRSVTSQSGKCVLLQQSVKNSTFQVK